MGYLGYTTTEEYKWAARDIRTAQKEESGLSGIYGQCQGEVVRTQAIGQVEPVEA